MVRGVSDRKVLSRGGDFCAVFFFRKSHKLHGKFLHTNISFSAVKQIRAKKSDVRSNDFAILASRSNPTSVFALLSFRDGISVFATCF